MLPVRNADGVVLAEVGGGPAQAVSSAAASPAALALAPQRILMWDETRAGQESLRAVRVAWTRWFLKDVHPKREVLAECGPMRAELA